jgi:adenylyltransferase/sulfurtransferase
MGTLQAAEAIKLLLGQGALLTDRMLVFNALKASFRQVVFSRRPGCVLCGERA